MITSGFQLWCLAHGSLFQPLTLIPASQSRAEGTRIGELSLSLSLCVCVCVWDRVWECLSLSQTLWQTLSLSHTHTHTHTLRERDEWMIDWWCKETCDWPVELTWFQAPHRTVVVKRAAAAEEKTRHESNTHTHTRLFISNTAQHLQHFCWVAKRPKIA